MTLFKRIVCSAKIFNSSFLKFIFLNKFVDISTDSPIRVQTTFGTNVYESCLWLYLPNIQLKNKSKIMVFLNNTNFCRSYSYYDIYWCNNKNLLSIYYNIMITKNVFRTTITGTVLSNILLKHLCRQNPPYIAVSELRS